MTEPEHHRALIHLAAETHNARDRDRFLACYGAEMIVRWGDREVAVTPDEHWEAVLSWEATFNGFRETVLQTLVEDDLVLVRSRYEGVHSGEWMGLPATGKQVAWEAWQILRIEDGLIVEERMLMDEWLIYQQLTSDD